MLHCTQSICPVEGGGGIPELTAADIAGALGLAHISRLQAELLYVSYCGYPRHGLFALTIMEIESRWPEWLGSGIAPQITKVALDRVVPREREPNQVVRAGICKHCGGTGTDHADAKKPVCPVCSGSGDALMPMFDAVWRQRLDALIDHLRWLEDEAIHSVRV